MFQHNAKLACAPPLPALANVKKAIWRNLLFIQIEVISLVAMHKKELWLVKKNPATLKPLELFLSSWNENLQRNLQI